MGKKLLLFFVVLVAVICIAAPIPVYQQFAVTIKAGYFNTYQLLYNPENWLKWQPGTDNTNFKKASKLTLVQNVDEYQLTLPNKSFLIRKQGSNNMLITKTTGKNKLNYGFTITSDPLGINTVVFVTLKTSILKYLMPFLANADLENTGIIDFKSFMENTRRYYGFDIKNVYQPEMNILVNSRTVVKKNIINAGTNMVRQIRFYLSAKQITVSQPIMIQYAPMPNDSLKMMVGIPVNTPLPANIDFKVMHIPATRVLTANFKGLYRDKQFIYTAFEKYIQDKFLHPKISPIEIFKHGFPSNSGATDFDLVYPIF